MTQVQPAPTSDEPQRPQDTITLQEASERLGVHYMTAYRYVRTGRLPARKSGATWEVDLRDVERFRTGTEPGSGRRGAPAHARRVPELADRLLAGDEAGAWTIAMAALTAGAAPRDLYLELFSPALREIGERWARGAAGIADEHTATVVMQRLVGRMGPLFRRRGRPRGSVVLGAPEGELHALPTALAADLLRGEGFAVVDLGANVPARSFVDCVRRLPAVVAVGIAVTTPGHHDAVHTLVEAFRRGGVDAPLIVGGSGIDESEARRLGADAYAADAAGLVALLEQTVAPTP